VPAASTPTTLHVEVTDLTAPLFFDLAAAYADVRPDVSLASTMASPAALTANLDAGRADLGLLVSADPDQFATPLGYVTFVVVVHPTNPISDLSAAQLREIYAGRVTDWGQVGGVPVAPLPGSLTGGAVQPVGREDNSDAAQAFGTNALLGASPSANSLVAPTWDAMREAVSQNPGAVGYLPAPELDASVKVVSVDTPMRVLIVAVASREPSGPAREFVAWVQSAAGQAIVAQRYERVR
jgi:phosphate transport system substrate-binding protein